MNAFWLWSTPLSVFLAPYSRSSYHFKHVFIKTPEMNILHTLNMFNSSVSKRDVSWILTQGSCQERRNDPIFMSVIKELNCKLFKCVWLHNRKDGRIDKLLEHVLNLMHNTYCISLSLHPIFLWLYKFVLPSRGVYTLSYTHMSPRCESSCRC